MRRPCHVTQDRVQGRALMFQDHAQGHTWTHQLTLVRIKLMEAEPPKPPFPLPLPRKTGFGLWRLGQVQSPNSCSATEDELFYIVFCILIITWLSLFPLSENLL